MNDTTIATTDKLAITKDRVKGWEACASGYKWFLEKFPQGAQFSDVYASLQADKRYEDSGWLIDKVFAELDTAGRVQQTVFVSGADKQKIEKSVAEGSNAATTGNWANAATTGNGANAATTGEGSNAATTGYQSNAATTGKGSIAASLGIASQAKASAGGAIVVCHRLDDGKLIAVRATMAGQDGVKPDVWYSLDAKGEFVEVPE